VSGSAVNVTDEYEDDSAEYDQTSVNSSYISTKPKEPDHNIFYKKFSDSEEGSQKEYPAYLDALIPNFGIRTKFEVNQLCYIFLGYKGKLFYEACMFCYLLGTLWLYSAVAATSLTAYVPVVGLDVGETCDSEENHFPENCQYAYYIWMAIVACFVVPTSCMDLTDQVILQVAMCLFRFLAMGLICVTTIVAMARNPIEPSVTGPPYFAYTELFNFSGFGLILTTSIFAQLIHYGVPGIVQPVRDKSKLVWIFSIGCTITMLMYLALGILCSMYFGHDTKQLITLNWTGYNGDFHSSSEGVHKEWWAYIISYTVILFPVATTTTGFPLIAITLGNNIYAGLPSKWTKNQTSRPIKILCRLIAAIPPIIGATFLREVSLLIELTGLCGFFIGYVLPGLVQYMAVRVCVAKWGEAGLRSPYTWHFSHNFYIFSIIVLVFLAFIYTVLEMIIGKKYVF